MPKRALTATWNGIETIVARPLFRIFITTANAEYAAILDDFDNALGGLCSKVGYGTPPEIAICDLVEQLV